MNITYKPGDRVLTKIQGAEMEASIVRVTVDLEVKTPDGKTWWRALGRVRPSSEIAPATPANIEIEKKAPTESLPAPVPSKGSPVEPPEVQPSSEPEFMPEPWNGVLEPEPDSTKATAPRNQRNRTKRGKGKK